MFEKPKFLSRVRGLAQDDSLPDWIEAASSVDLQTGINALQKGQNPKVLALLNSKIQEILEIIDKSDPFEMEAFGVLYENFGDIFPTVLLELIIQLGSVLLEQRVPLESAVDHVREAVFGASYVLASPDLLRRKPDFSAADFDEFGLYVDGQIEDLQGAALPA